MHDDELLFEVSLEIMCEVHCRHSRPAVNEEYYRLLSVDASCKKILAITVDFELVQIGNRSPREDRHRERLERVQNRQHQDQRACGQ